MTEITSSCARAEEIRQAADEGRGPTEEEADFLAEHARHCDACAAELAAAELLSYEEGDPHVEPLDDLAGRRFVDQVLSEVAEADTAPPARPARSSFVAGAAVAAPAAVVIIGLVLYGGGSGRQDVGGHGGDPLAAPASVARTLLVSGESNADSGPLRPGQAIAPGEWLSVGRGRLALGLPRETSLLAREGSLLKIDASPGEATEITLERGSLLAVVTPGADEPWLSVRTSTGRVTVTGTVFEVQVADGTATARVLRGSVRVEEPERPGRDLRASEKTIIGGNEILPIDGTEDLAMRADARGLELLALGDGVSLELQSIPPGRGWWSTASPSASPRWRCWAAPGIAIWRWRRTASRRFVSGSIWSPAASYRAHSSCRRPPRRRSRSRRHRSRSLQRGPPPGAARSRWPKRALPRRASPPRSCSAAPGGCAPRGTGADPRRRTRA